MSKETHHDGGHNEKAAHQNPEYEKGGASRMLNHLHQTLNTGEVFNHLSIPLS